MADRSANVFVALGNEELHAGRVFAHRRRGVESATFTYDETYLAHPRAYPFEPALPLVGGPQQTASSRATFAAFSDCAPNRWGRRLINRSEALRVGEAGEGAPRAFGEMDYLLGVRDDLRQGALRFRDPKSDEWLASEAKGIPDLLDLPDLLGASERLERDEAGADELRRLLRGGSSLGGARPKAHVRAADGSVAMAKFPRPATDEWDVMRWEAITLQLARDAGLRVAHSELHTIDGKSVLILDRFDRDNERRVGYASAMTLLEAVDGDRASYLDIAAVIEEESPRVGADLRELWGRIVFTVLVSNTDDHLRNHGFLRDTQAGWRLSPAFDVNPCPGRGTATLTTSIDGRSDEARLDLALEVAPRFRLEAEDARTALARVQTAVAGWRGVARRHGAPAVEIKRMAGAFDRSTSGR